MYFLSPKDKKAHNCKVFKVGFVKLFDKADILVWSIHTLNEIKTDVTWITKLEFSVCNVGFKQMFYSEIEKGAH